MILHALDEGCRSFIIGIGGSATNDGGTGMLRALGCRFRKTDGTDIAPGAQELAGLATIETEARDPCLKESCFSIACDVTNPLCGPNGASYIFAPQKGADPATVRKLDAALAHLADITAATLGTDLRDQPGAGAAGGLGFAFASYLNGTLRPGVDIVLDAVLPESELRAADIVVTGEGASMVRPRWAKHRSASPTAPKPAAAKSSCLPAASSIAAHAPPSRIHRSSMPYSRFCRVR